MAGDFAPASSTQITEADRAAKVEASNAKMEGWTDLPDGHVLVKMSEGLGDIVKEAGYSEMYGVELAAPGEGQKVSPFSTLLVLSKFLRANQNSVSKAGEQLLGALKWRKEFQPLKVKKEVFDKEKFEGLGYVTELMGVPESGNEVDVCTFNIYGAVKDTKKTFGDVDDFIRWRVALMEITLEKLQLDKATQPIPDHGKGPDPHQAIQIHDYLSVSFLRQPAEVKAASQKAIQLFSAHYPETLSKKYFVNVPLFMQWMFGAMQVFMAKETVQKMQWMSYGSELHKYLGPSVAKDYGGSGPDLKDASVTPLYEGVTEAEVDSEHEASSSAAAKEVAI